MQISCERCGTTYQLDERLIPAGGAPVQCTRCGHVFTAYPPNAAPPPAATPAAPKPETHKTMIFGSSTPAPVPEPRSSTQMFGAPKAPSAPPVPQAPAKASVPPGAVQIQGAAAPKSSTQMFGAVAPPAAPAPRPPASTQMFGGTDPAPPPGPQVTNDQLTVPGGGARSSTQMFGAVAPPSPAAPAPRPPASTQMFGVTDSGPREPLIHEQVTVPYAARPTAQMISAAGGQQVTHEQVTVPYAARASTQMFGGLSPEPAPAATPPAGKSGPKGAPPERTPTAQMFQAVQPPAPLPISDREPTLQFSSVPSAPAVPKQTQVFGALDELEPAPATPDQAPSSPWDAPTPQPAEPAPNLSTTQVFGTPTSRAPSSPPAPVLPVLPKIFSKTPVPLPDESFADTLIRDRHRQPDPKSAARTEMFGAPDLDDLDRQWQERQEKKRQAQEAGPNATTIPENPEQLGPAVTPVESPFLDNAPTPVEVARASPSSETPPVSRLELPPEAPELLPEPRTQESQPMDEAAVLRRSLERRTRVVAGVVIAALLVVVGGIAGRVLLGRRQAVPPDAIARLESVHLLLRRDDGQARERAISELVAMVGAYPDYIPAHADLVVAMALQLDDARIQTRRLTEESDKLSREVARLSAERVPSDWENRVHSMQSRLAEIGGQNAPLVQRAAVLDAQLKERFQALQGLQPSSGDDQKAVTRAQAVYSGVTGNDQAIALAERYRNLGGTDGWAAIALAELALNARVSPDTMTASHAEMDELATKDHTFLRSYVLSARLSLAQKHHESAIAGLEAVLALNPAHEVARQLLEWARSGEPER